MRRMRIVYPVVLAAALSGAVVAQPRTAVAPTLTQAAPDALVDHAALLERLARIATSDRAAVEIIGTSAGGRAIPMVVLTAPGGERERWAERARAISGPRVAFRTVSDREVAEPDLERLIAEARMPVVFAGASWGHEAAQVEGLVAAAEHLAFDRSPETERLLRKTVALIVPLMNPDGREQSLAEWRRTPLSAGSSGVGNKNDFMINRDFIHLTQPESRAMLAVARRWRPVVGIDLHEDMFHLGVETEEVAFVPPFMAGVDAEEHPSTRRLIQRVGGAIAARWRDSGYRVAHDPEGSRTFAPMPPSGSTEINPVAGSSGRLEFLWNIHGMTGLITESARTPGAQSWEARVDQKKLAVLAALETVAADPALFARTTYDRRAASLRQAAATHGFLVIPHEQPEGADRLELLRLVRAHDVLAYEALGAPYDLLPLGQPEEAFVRHALLAERSALNDLPAALGVRVIRSEDLPAGERAHLARATLRALPEPPDPWPARRAPAKPLRIAVFVGQGVEPAASGELTFVLEWLGHRVIPLTSADLARGRVQEADAIVIGDGDAAEVVNGWDVTAAGRRAPWQPAEAPSGIGEAGVRALAAFVRRGGRLVTVGRAAGLVVHPVAALLPIEIVGGTAGHPGIGQVQLAVDKRGAWLFRGVPVRGAQPRAFLHAPAGAGYVFRAPAALVAARYAGAETREGDRSFSSRESISADSGHAAIISGPAGRGHVTVFGIAPTFRAQWRSTFPLLVNAAMGPGR